MFRAQDTADFVRAARAVLDDPAAYRKAYDDPELLAEWTWDAQAAVLDGVYQGLLADAAEATAPVTALSDGTAAEEEPEPGDPAGATAT